MIQFDDNDYYDKKKLKPEFLLHYSYFPHWSEHPYRIQIVIDIEYSFEVTLMWYKSPLLKRLFSNYKSNLIPENIKILLETLSNSKDARIGKFYSNSTDTYAPDGIAKQSYSINHPANYISICMDPYYTNEELFITDEERLFLKLHHAIWEWKESIYKNIINLHK